MIPNWQPKQLESSMVGTPFSFFISNQREINILNYCKIAVNFYVDHADSLTDTFVLRIIDYLIEQVGPFPALHDELLSQMCKQTFKNPEP